MSFREYLQELEEDYASFEHEIIWMIVGERLAHGKCRKCGATIVAERSGSHYHKMGTVIREPCPKKD